MGLFDAGAPNTLADVLGRQAETSAMGVNQNYAQKRKRLVSQQAASGRLRSGVANYPLADLEAGRVGDLSNVYGGLSDALAGVPTQDYLEQRQYERDRALAELIASLNKPSGLQEAFGAVGSIGKIAGTVAPLMAL